MTKNFLSHTLNRSIYICASQDIYNNILRTLFWNIWCHYNEDLEWPGETWECSWRGERRNPEEEGSLRPDPSWILTVWAQLFSWGRFSVSCNKTSLKWYEKLWSVGSDHLECHIEEALSLKSPEERFEPCQHLDFRLTQLLLDVQSTEL